MFHWSRSVHLHNNRHLLCKTLYTGRSYSVRWEFCTARFLARQYRQVVHWAKKQDSPEATHTPELSDRRKSVLVYWDHLQCSHKLRHRGICAVHHKRMRSPQGYTPRGLRTGIHLPFHPRVVHRQNPGSNKWKLSRIPFHHLNTVKRECMRYSHMCHLRWDSLRLRCKRLLVCGTFHQALCTDHMDIGIQLLATSTCFRCYLFRVCFVALYSFSHASERRNIHQLLLL